MPFLGSELAILRRRAAAIVGIDKLFVPEAFPENVGGDGEEAI